MDCGRGVGRGGRWPGGKPPEAVRHCVQCPVTTHPAATEGGRGRIGISMGIFCVAVIVSNGAGTFLP